MENSLRVGEDQEDLSFTIHHWKILEGGHGTIEG